MKRTVLAAVFCLLPAARADWPQFRGPNGSGVAQATGLPVHFGPKENVVWRTALPGGHSSPAIVGDRIYVTAFEGDKLLVYCLKADNGEIVWRREAPRRRVTKSRAANTPASPSPVADRDGVYVFFEDFGLIAYGSDDQERWRHPLGPLNTPYGVGASPIVVDDKVVLVCDQDTGSFMIAVDRKDGKLRWKADRAEFTHGFSTPVVYQPKSGSPEIIVSGAYQVAAYSAGSGEKLWWIRGMAWQAKSTPVLDGDRLYVHSWMASLSELGQKTNDLPGFAEMLKTHDANHDGKLSPDEVDDPEMKKVWFLFDLDKDGLMDEREWNIHRARGTAGNGLFAIKLGGRGDLTDTAVVWRYEKSLPNIPSPVLYRGVIYVLREGGVFTALNAATGAVLKQGRLEGALDPYFASPVAADGKIYTVSQNGKVAVVRAGADWSVLAVNDLDEEAWATPAIDGGRLYVRTKAALYCFGKKASG